MILFLILDFIPKNHIFSTHAYHLYVLRFNFKKFKKNKIKFFNYLYSKGINLQVHYMPLHLQPFYKTNYKFSKGDFPNAEKYYDEAFSLPIYPDLKIEQMKYVSKTILNYLVKDNKY